MQALAGRYISTLVVRPSTLTQNSQLFIKFLIKKEELDTFVEELDTALS